MTAFLASLLDEMEDHVLAIAEAIPAMPGEQAAYLEGYVDALNLARRLVAAGLPQEVA